MAEDWGVGNKADAKAFATADVEGKEVELIHGEHPHSRRDSTTYARWPDGSVEGFAGHRVRRRIEIEESNYLKTSGLSGNEVRKACSCTIYFNDKPVYAFGAREAPAALLRARHIIGKLEDLPIHHWDKPEEEIVGRKVFYRDDPAVITDFFADQGAIVLKADGCSFRPPAWQQADEEEMAMRAADGNDQEIKDDILSPHIWWFRD